MSGNDLEPKLHNALEVTLDQYLDLSGLAKPVSNNAVKAIGRLATAIVDIPVAFLEGKSNEVRAISAGKVALTNAVTTQMINQLEVPEIYAKKAGKKVADRIVGQQKNLDIISKNAIDELKKNPTIEVIGEADTGDSVEISDDWLNVFQAEAVLKSTESAQALFGKILAGEISRPGTFSEKAIRTLSQLDPKTAALFERLCSLASSLWLESRELDCRVISNGGNAGANALREFGLDFGGLNRLLEHGLIIADFHSYVDYDGAVVVATPSDEVIAKAQFTIRMDGRTFVLKAIRENLENPVTVRVHGVALSNVGRELFAIVNKTAEPSYSAAVHAFFAGRNLELMEISPTAPPP